MIRKLLKKLSWRDGSLKSEDDTEKATNESSSPSINKSGEYTKVSQPADITTYANNSQPRNEIKESMRAIQPVLKQNLKTLKWETVYVFISSTFNDMHAERDYLIKNVFPQLQEWCENRKLRLVDIDLRWGVTEQDALYRKNVVKVSLDRIDQCRPFFLCFLGQRRGWVPKEKEISPETFDSFPDLKPYTGSTSVTEMEILHALISPLHHNKERGPGKNSEYYEKVKYAFFYLRDPSYLSHIPNEPLLLRQTYTNEGIEDKNELAMCEQKLKKWREEEIPNSGRPWHFYQAKWDPQASTPELNIPLQCPSTEPINIKEWRDKWEKAGVLVSSESTNIEDIKDEAEKAKKFNEELCKGRLVDFKCGDISLSNVIIEDLQKAITSRYPDHVEIKDKTDLQKELDQQEQFLFLNSEGFIEREGDFDELNNYVNGDSNKLFVLTALGGMGKSTLLANWVDRFLRRVENVEEQSIHFRFIGASDRSTTIYSLIRFLLCEMKETEHKFDDEIPEDPEKLLEAWPKMLKTAGKHGKTVIVIDALDQLETGFSILNWLPRQLPPNIKLIVSFKRGEQAAEEFYQQLEISGQVILSKVKPFEKSEDRKKLVNTYLSQYLKDLDEQHIQTLIQSPGASNPLYLKVVLSELRVFGAFSNLGKKIREDFGETPVSAFQGVLNRLETDPVYSEINLKQAVPLLFGLMAHARHGLSADELASLFIQELKLDDTEEERKNAKDTVYLFLRQVRPFLARREERYDFFYESFKSAAKERYVEKNFEEGLRNKRHSALVEYFCDQPPTIGSNNASNIRKVSELPLPKEWHSALAKYFCDQPLTIGINNTPNIRKIFEFPYQLAWSEEKEALEYTLCKLDFIDVKCSAGMFFDLLEDYNRRPWQTEQKAAVKIKKALFFSKNSILYPPKLHSKSKFPFLVQCLYNLVRFETTDPLIAAECEWARNLLDCQDFWICSESQLPSIMNVSTPPLRFRNLSTLHSIYFDKRKLAVAHNHSLEIFDLNSGKSTTEKIDSSIKSIALSEMLSLIYCNKEGIIQTKDSSHILLSRSIGDQMIIHPKLGLITPIINNSLVAWDAKSGGITELVANIPAPLRTLRISKDGNILLFIAGIKKETIVGVTSCYNNIWKTKFLQCDMPAIDADFDVEAQLILIASIDRSLSIYNMADWKCENIIYYQERTEPVFGEVKKCRLGVGPSSGWAFIALDKGQVARWDWKEDIIEIIGKYPLPNDGSFVVLMEVLPVSGHLLITTKRDGLVFDTSKSPVYSCGSKEPVSECIIANNNITVSARLRGYLVEMYKDSSLKKPIIHYIRFPSSLAAGSSSVFIGNQEGDVTEVAYSNEHNLRSIISCKSPVVSLQYDATRNCIFIALKNGDIICYNLLNSDGEKVWHTTGYQSQIKIQPVGQHGMIFSLHTDEKKGNGKPLPVISLILDKDREKVVYSGFGIRDIASSADGNLLAIVTEDSIYILLHGPSGWQCKYQRTTSNTIKKIALAYNGALIAVIIDKCPWIELWEISDGLPTVAVVDTMSEPACIHCSDYGIVVGCDSGDIVSLSIQGKCR